MTHRAADVPVLVPDFEWHCPHCGKWINAGEGKWMPDNFVVHRWCW